MNAAGDRVAIGAYYNDGNGVNSGSTRIYGVGVTYTNYNVTTLAGDGGTAIDNEGDYLSTTFTALWDITMMHDGNLLVADNGEWKVGNTLQSFRRIKKIKNTTGYKDTFDITISSNRSNLVLEDLLYRRGWDGKSAVTCTLTISSGVYVYADKPVTPNLGSAKPAFTVGDKLTNGSTINIINNGTIVGAGGTHGSSAAIVESNGSDAMYIRSNINLKNNGIIGGGGGAGGSAGAYMIENFAINNEYLVVGGDGSGISAKTSPTSRTLTINSTPYSFSGGNSGNLGQNGSSGICPIGGTAKNGTLAGKSIDGISFVTIDPSSTGTLSGATI